MEFPMDIISKIKEFTCVKKQNNVFSREFLIVLKSGFNIDKECENEIMTWLVNNLQQTLFELEEDQIDLIYGGCGSGDEGELNKEIRILVHFKMLDSLFQTDDDGIICINEFFSGNIINPKKILDNLNNEHKFINKIGVSGISEKLIKELWWKMVGEDAGFMCYKNCYCIAQEQYFMQRERSFNFGWENYPKQERDVDE
jgi:hypothetical protein